MWPKSFPILAAALNSTSNSRLKIWHVLAGLNAYHYMTPNTRHILHASDSSFNKASNTCTLLGASQRGSNRCCDSKHLLPPNSGCLNTKHDMLFVFNASNTKAQRCYDRRRVFKNPRGT